MGDLYVNGRGGRDSAKNITSAGPREPQSIAEAGIAERTIETLVLKILYSRGELYGRDLSLAVGLRFSAIQDIVETLIVRHHVQVKRSLGVGNVGAVLALTDAGRERAREAMEANRYAGPAPVPLEQYIAIVEQQRPQHGWLTRAALARALSGMVVTEHLLSQLGPAIGSSKSLLLYGKPGDGKTFLIESLNNLDAAQVFVPYAIECQGNLVQVFDPVYHKRIDTDEMSVLTAVGDDAPHDQRWVKCRRPFIVSGGELTLDMLDLRYNDVSKMYEAPFQLKANNGIYLIDDFGRQRATPAEVLNRWIVPMERRLDYLSFLTGGKMTVPFETFLVFSTNLNPADLGDEAFLRRIQYKMLLRGPARNEFMAIFKNFCTANDIPYRLDVVEQFIDECYRKTGKAFRRCHPRDVLTHALGLMDFERLPRELTFDLLMRAFQSCFIQEDEGTTPPDALIARPAAKDCADYWVERIGSIPTAFGRLAFVASFRDRASGSYQTTEAQDYADVENSRILTGLHARAFREWMAMTTEQQSHDLARYLSTPDGRAAFLRFNHRELGDILAASDLTAEQKNRFRSDLASLMLMLSNRGSHDESVPAKAVVARP